MPTPFCGSFADGGTSLQRNLVNGRWLHYVMKGSPPPPPGHPCPNPAPTSPLAHGLLGRRPDALGNDRFCCLNGFAIKDLDCDGERAASVLSPRPGRAAGRLERGLGQDVFGPDQLCDESGVSHTAGKPRIGRYLAHAGALLMDLLHG